MNKATKTALYVMALVISGIIIGFGMGAEDNIVLACGIISSLSWSFALYLDESVNVN